MKQWLLLGLGVLLCWGCEQNLQRSGKELAEIYCARCHQYVSPELLPKEVWKQDVLPYMGARMGMSKMPDTLYKDYNMMEAQQVKSAGIYAPKPYMSEADWQRLQAYIIAQAPETLTVVSQTHWQASKRFKSSFPELPFKGKPYVSMVDIEPKSKSVSLASANGQYAKLKADFETTDFAEIPGVIVHQQKLKEDLLMLGIAPSLMAMYPAQRPTGALIRFENGELRQFNLAAGGLVRPVHFELADLNQDGDKDLIICQFGHLIGKLSWFEFNGREYEERIIKAVPGATKVYVEDLDGDDDMDLIVQFAQGNEGISMFLNDGAGNFLEKRLLNLPSIMGSSDFEWLDLDADGDKDIVLTNGDNGDRTMTLKPYHGLRIYLNDGDYRFAERLFFPLYGASKVRSKDFDLDGDMDFMVISFFPDYVNGAEKSVLYLENQGDWQMAPQYFPEANQGRWMVMDADDLDGDGDADVVLGSFLLKPQTIPDSTFKAFEVQGRQILYLENTTR
ncbi:MAG: VCBS repeat-containing protein [Bacteroidota bacterium]